MVKADWASESDGFPFPEAVLLNFEDSRVED